MGWAARANPCALDGKTAQRVVRARLERVCGAFPTRAEYLAYLDAHGATPQQRAYLDGLLPDHLGEAAA
jgi:hypothetical protein